MKFKLKVRKPKFEDVRRSYPYLTDEEEYNTYLNTLHEHLTRIEHIDSLKKEGDTFSFNSDKSIQDIKVLIMPSFSELFDHLRCDGLTEEP